ncbi:LysE family translocator [Crenobacter caeni]|uniref:LysE family transporter n=1 Tax=Crenobacter caeni TaxID=2705474 RepID=A0A6B2KUL0_9NEIS|nr:LysE family transporter [Crenobacter caeni]NDV13841.1 LysE family transporter [Crenobacter caeni]
MSSATLFWQSALVGLSVAAPLGPIGLLCMQRSLESGARRGFVSGLGAASADMLYALLGALGAGALVRVFVGWENWLAAAGAAFMLWLALGMLRAPSTVKAAGARDGGGLLAAYTSVLALTATNPLTVSSFIAIFATLGVRQETGTGSLLFALGVFAGSALWWALLSAGCSVLGRQLDVSLRVRINRAAGLLLAAFALFKLAQLAT